jgi:hypothetical protein
MIAALEPRVKAVVSVGWMTTGDTQQAYNLAGAIGTFCLLPGVWNRLDVPDLIAMAAPRACMVVGGTEDQLFPPLGQKEATRQIAEAFNWASPLIASTRAICVSRRHRRRKFPPVTRTIDAIPSSSMRPCSGNSTPLEHWFSERFPRRRFAARSHPRASE